MAELAFLREPLLNYIIPITFFFLVAYFFQRAAPTLAKRLRPYHKNTRHTRERIETMQLGEFAFEGYPVTFWDVSE